jgi:hypothetical protein
MPLLRQGYDLDALEAARVTFEARKGVLRAAAALGALADIAGSAADVGTTL